MHKTIVIGRGLFGSAATRHLAEKSDGILCVGPDEPANPITHMGVFGSHYDEVRMTRVADPSIEWATTAKKSIERYANLETRSGIKFYAPSGYLGIGDPNSDYNECCTASAALVGVSTEKLSALEIREKFPFFSVNNDSNGLLEIGSAGHINPAKWSKRKPDLLKWQGLILLGMKLQKFLRLLTVSKLNLRQIKSCRLIRSWLQLAGLHPHVG